MDDRSWKSHPECFPAAYLPDDPVHSLTIPPRQFAQVSRQPWAVIAGLVLNFLFMPLVCWVLARLLVSDPALATGIILVGVVPCAGMAAVWTALLKGDVPLGMAINALTMLLAPFLIPPLMMLLAGFGVRIHPWSMFQQLAVILLFPLILGVLLRWLVDRFWNPKSYGKRSLDDILQIQVSVDADIPGATQEEIGAWLEETENRCPVTDNVRADTKISVTATRKN